MSGVASTVICTLGMHRSGTSLVSRMLSLVGVHLGPQHAMSGANEDNPKGYWEHHPLALLNDEILINFDGRWDRPPVFPSDWLTDPGLEVIREKARRILDEEFAGQPLWGWKDPRTCLTTPFWRDLIGPMRYVICVRNPRAVAASLERRDGMGLQRADRLWLTYVAASLTHTSGQPRLFVFYEDLMADWAAQLQRLAAFVGRPDRAEDASARAAVAEFIEPELFHHRMTVEDLTGDPAMSFPTRSLYLAVRAHAKPHIDQTSLDLLAAQTMDETTRQDAAAAAHDRLVEAHEARSADVIAIRAQRDDLMTGVTAVSAHRDSLIADIGALGAQRDGLIGDVTWHSAERDRLAAATLALVEERDQAAARASLAAAEAATLGARLETANQGLEEIRSRSAWRRIFRAWVR